MSQLGLRVGRYNNQPSVYQLTVTRDGVDDPGLVATGGFSTGPKIKAACRDELRGMVMPDDLREAIAAFRAAGSPKGETVVYVVPTRATDTPPLVFERRRVDQTRGTASRFASFAEAIREPASPDEIVSWDKRNVTQACAVDIDWHGDSRYCTADDLRPLYDRINDAMPKPAFAWVTRNLGIRLVYTGPHAQYRAAVAGVDLVCRLWDHESRPTGLELKCDTRIAPVGHRVVPFAQDTEFVTRVEELDDEFDREAWTEYLADRDMVIGQRYSHDKCLVAPWRESKSGKPVEVRDNCIMCHSCAGYGTKGAYLHASRLLRDDSSAHSNDDGIAKMVRNFTHYEHAEFVLRQRIPPIITDAILRVYYRALLVKYHGDTDPRIDAVFNRYDAIRLNGIWSDLRGAPRKATLMKFTAAAMPATHGPDGVSQLRVEQFLDSGDLSCYGYPAIRPVFGMRVGTHHQPATDGVPRIVVPTAATTPSYIDEKQRKATGRSRDWAWSKLEPVWPGITREYIEMLIISRGMIERGDISVTPMFWLHEAKAAGKTSSINIAAGICGDHCTVIPPTAVSEDNHKELLYSLDKGSFVLFDEPGKEAMTLRKPLQFFRFLLQLSPRLQAKRLYHGPVTLGWLPVIALADTKWPDGFESDGQLGRRLFRVNLNPVKDRWDKTAPKFGIFDFSDPRRVAPGCEDVAEACDVLVSCIIDEYFGGTILPLSDIASNLGIRYMMDGDKHRERLSTLRDFYIAWHKYTPTTKSGIPGYKAFNVEEGSELSILWDKLRDPGDRYAFQGGENDEAWAALVAHPSRRLEMMPVKRPANLHTHVAVGFTHGDDRDAMVHVYQGGV